MSTIAQLKARLTLETEQYMQEANKVIRKTNTVGDHIAKTFSKIGKGYAAAAMDPLKQMFAASTIDQGLRSLADSINTVDFSALLKGKDAFDMLNNLADTFIKKIPIIGGAYEIGNSIANRFLGDSTDIEGMPGAPNKRFNSTTAEDRRKFSEQTKGATDVVKDLEYQRQLYEATNDEQRKRLELEHELQKALEVTNGIEEGKQKDIIRKDIEDRVKAVQAARQQAEERKKAEDERKRQADKIQRDLEQEQQQLSQAKERAAAEMESLKGANNVQGVGTAVGSVRVAGAIDYSSKGMATSLEKIREIEKEIAENTKNLKNLRPA